MKVVVPMPRADEDAAARPAMVPPPPDVPSEPPPAPTTPDSRHGDAPLGTTR
jgi:hypothetical protein